MAETAGGAGRLARSGVVPHPPSAAQRAAQRTASKRAGAAIGETVRGRWKGRRVTAMWEPPESARLMDRDIGSFLSESRGSRKAGLRAVPAAPTVGAIDGLSTSVQRLSGCLPAMLGLRDLGALADGAQLLQPFSSVRAPARTASESLEESLAKRARARGVPARARGFATFNGSCGCSFGVRPLDTLSSERTTSGATTVRARVEQGEFSFRELKSRRQNLLRAVNRRSASSKYVSIPASASRRSRRFLRRLFSRVRQNPRAM